MGAAALNTSTFRSRFPMKPRIDPQPDFARFKATLLLQKAWRRPPLFDFWIHPAHMQRVLGREATSAADWAESFWSFGYDFMHAPAYPPRPELHAVQQAEKTAGNAGSFSSEHVLISGPEAFRARRWSWQPIAEGDLSSVLGTVEWIEQAAAALRPGMKLVLNGADIFTQAWMLTGFNEFCMFSLEEPEFLRELMDELGAAQYNLLAECIRRVGDRVGAVFFSDDIAYTEGLMLGPKFFVSHLVPWIAKIADLGRRIDAPMIYHSDGKLFDIMDALVGAGVRGIQPLEPKSMDPLEIKKRWPGRLCLMGNIDLDLLARGTAEQAERHVREKIDRLNVGGGYIVGVSNTVPDYVRYENYVRMIETVWSYPLEEIAR
jgi:uroporphyrinogen decarboxylase